ncbi:MAG: hypothetical protein M1828_006812 [Chrysothrix sp. TS-e1954]|nr:MAG: hypothetical protein M1828_006812 [Chrysothrix sp. TS-e1954]
MTSPRIYNGQELLLNLSEYPSIFLLQTHLDEDEYDAIVEALVGARANLTFAASEARLFLTKIERKRRIEIELRSHDVWTKEISSAATNATLSTPVKTGDKRKRSDSRNLDTKAKAQLVYDGSSTESDPEVEGPSSAIRRPDTEYQDNLKTPLTLETVPSTRNPSQPLMNDDNVRVVKVSWVEDSVSARRVLPFAGYLLYEARHTERSVSTISSALCQESNHDVPAKGSKSTDLSRLGSVQGRETTILRTKVDAKAAQESMPPYAKARLGNSSGVAHRRQPSEQSAASKGRLASRAPALLQESTTEYDEDLTRDLPEPPIWVRLGLTYSCQRSTPINNPNDSFIEQLKKIRLARKLTSDEIGVRAYSTAIAAIAAYPYTLTSPREILSLPGCETKIAALFAEWKNNGEQRIQAVADIEHDEYLTVLRQFYDIWGVGSTTAREFYNKGWRDLDDVVEFGWQELSRIQQIGLKYYDEFLEKIPRAEVEFIESKVSEQMKRLCEPLGVRTCIVGGYRRGKAESGDADIIISHTDEEETADLIGSVVTGLTEAGWITHNLIVHTSGTKRNQATRPHNPSGGGHGFDSLDKAMVVWQDRNFTEPGPNGRNPNVHRRVDIIVAPWSKIGCAVLGWSAGTTFERDLRRYAKVAKGWKFDSSGIRDRATGRVVELEAHGGLSQTVEAAERKVFEGLDLEYREPWERCTG